MNSPLQAGSGTGKINFLSACCAIILAIGLMNHVMVMPPLLHAAKRDAWLSVLAALLPYLLWTTALYFIMKRTGQQPLLPWLRQRFGIPVSGAFRCFFVVYLFLIGTMTLKETAIWTQSSYLPRTPIIVLAGTLMLLCGWAASAGIRAIAICSGFLLPLVIVFGDFVMSANVPKKNYSLLTPIMENGPLPVVKGSVFIGGGLAELLVFLLIQHHIQSKVRPWWMWALSVFLIVLVFGPVTGAIAEFGPFEAAELRYPAFEEWRLVSIGKYIRHVDFLSIYQWLSGAFIRIALALYMLMDLLAPNRKATARKLWLLLLVAVMLMLIALPFSDMQYLDFLRHYYLPGSLLTSTGMLGILFLLVVLRSKKGGGEPA